MSQYSTRNCLTCILCIVPRKIKMKSSSGELNTVWLIALCVISKLP